MGIAKMKVDNKSLLNMLHLPDDTRIMSISIDWRGMISMVISHPDIAPGTAEVTPKFKSRHDKTGKTAKVEFVAWN